MQVVVSGSVDQAKASTLQAVGRRRGGPPANQAALSKKVDVIASSIPGVVVAADMPPPGPLLGATQS